MVFSSAMAPSGWGPGDAGTVPPGVACGSGVEAGSVCVATPAILAVYVWLEAGVVLVISSVSRECDAAG